MSPANPSTNLKAKLVYWGFFLLVVMLGGLLRAQAIQQSSVYAPVRSDAADYLSYAFNLKYHGVYSRNHDGMNRKSDVAPQPDLVRTPGYPLFLMPQIDKVITYQHLTRISYLQAGLGTVLIILIMLICRPFLPATATLGVGLLTALSPHLININLYLLSESLFALLLILMLWLFQSMRKNSNMILALGVGFALGAATLTRPWIQYFVIVLVVYLLLLDKTTCRKKLSLALFVGFMLIVSPWYLRNLMTFGMLDSPDAMARSMLHGSYPGMMYQNNPDSFGFPYRYDPLIQNMEMTLGSVLSYIWERASQQPGVYAEWYLVKKIAVLFSWDIVQGMGDAFIYNVTASPYFTQIHFILSHALMVGLHPLLHLLASVGAVLIWSPSISIKLNRHFVESFRLLSLLFIYFVAVHMVFAPFPRYAIPMQPITYALAIGCIMMIIRFFRKDEGKIPKFTG